MRSRGARRPWRRRDCVPAALVLVLGIHALMWTSSVAHQQHQVGSLQQRWAGDGADQLGAPISDWFFVLRASAGWFSTKWCGFSGAATEGVIVCDRTDAPLFSLFTLVNPTGEVPGRTGHNLLLVSRSGGLCGTPSPEPPPPPPPESGRQLQLPGAPQASTATAAPVVNTRVGVVCSSSQEAPSSVYQLIGEEPMPGSPIDLWAGKSFYLTENGRFCAPGDTNTTKAALVCDLTTTATATKFALLPAAFPFAGLTSLASRARCGAKVLMLPPPHDIACTGTPTWAHHSAPSQQPSVTTQPEHHLASSSSQQPAAALAGAAGQVALLPAAQHASGSVSGVPRPSSRQRVQRVQRLVREWWWRARAGASVLPLGSTWWGRLTSWCDTICKWTSPAGRMMQWLLCRGACGAGPSPPPPGEDRSRAYSLTLLLQKPGSNLTSGSVIGLATYAPGLVGFPLQQCCAEADSPHMVDCGVATGDPVPAPCWFNMLKVDGKSGQPIRSGDLVMLQSRAFARWCSITVDGTLLCVSASSSNASRNLFTYQELLSRRPRTDL